MTVVSDTSPLSYLVLIAQTKVLPDLFGAITIPADVRRELEDPAGPAEIRDWIAAPPRWLTIDAKEQESSTEAVEPDLDRLHAGERAAIRLAVRLGADLVLLDDKAARTAAKARSLRVTGLLGVLKEGAAQGSLDLVDSLERLRQTNFRASPELLKSLLEGR